MTFYDLYSLCVILWLVGTQEFCGTLTRWLTRWRCRHIFSHDCICTQWRYNEKRKSSATVTPSCRYVPKEEGNFRLTIYSVVIFSHRYFDNDRRIHFKTFVCLGCLLVHRTSSYMIQLRYIKVQQFFQWSFHKSHKIVLVNSAYFFLIFRKCRKSSENNITPSCNRLNWMTNCNGILPSGKLSLCT